MRDKNDFSVLCRVRIGTEIRSGNDFVREFRRLGVRVTESAIELLSSPSFTVVEAEREVELVAAKVSQLGWYSGADSGAILKKAVKLGYELCPAEVGPQLCLQLTLRQCYLQQAFPFEWLLIGMKPLSVYWTERPLVFHLEEDHRGFSLGVQLCDDDICRPHYNTFAFMRRRK